MDTSSRYHLRSWSGPKLDIRVHPSKEKMNARRAIRIPSAHPPTAHKLPAPPSRSSAGTHQAGRGDAPDGFRNISRYARKREPLKIVLPSKLSFQFSLHASSGVLWQSGTDLGRALPPKLHELAPQIRMAKAGSCPWRNPAQEWSKWSSRNRQAGHMRRQFAQRHWTWDVAQILFCRLEHAPESSVVFFISSSNSASKRSLIGINFSSGGL